MRTRVAVLVVASMILTTLVITPAMAHHDDGKGDVNAPAIDVLMHEFENVVAAGAPEDSNAHGASRRAFAGRRPTPTRAIASTCSAT